MKSLRPLSAVPLMLLIAAILAAALVSGCGSQDSSGPPNVVVVPPDDGGDDGGDGGGDDGGDVPNTVTVEIAPASITAGDAGATVTATILDGDGGAVPNVAVAFRVGSSAVASLSESSATTNNAGQASVTVTGLRAGTSTITATESGVSATATLTVAAPLIDVELTPEDGEIVASTTAGAGATVTFTVTDQGGTPLSGKTVTFATTGGTLDASSRNTDADGQVSVKLTSEEVGTALVSASVLGKTSSAASISIVAGEPDSLELATSASTISSNDSATLSLQATDAFGNPVEGVSVALVATLVSTEAETGDISPSQVELVGGSGEATFTPSEEGVVRVTAFIDGVEITFVDISIELQLAGEPAKIQFNIAEDEREITVKGSGGTESATIEITVLDVNDDPIVDRANNLSVKIISGPNGGESLDGLATINQTRTLSTNGGVATTILQSGTRPGTVLIQVSVTKDSNGNDLDTPLVATVPQITIRAGSPASLFLTRANAIQSPGLAGNGSITHEHLAFVSDLWGNAVPDGTIVFFSQFLNIKTQCRTRAEFNPDEETDPLTEQNGYVEFTCEGASAGSIELSGYTDDTGTHAVFHSGSVSFEDVVTGDTLVILTEDNPLGFGGYRIYKVLEGGMSVVLDNDFAFDLEENPEFEPFLEGLQWAVGNNANLGGSVFTTEGTAATEGGVATWSNTYAGELVNSPVFVFAEAEGGTQAHARYFRLSWLADTAIEQSGGIESGDEVSDASGPYLFTFWVEDASSPTPYAIADLVLTVTTSGGTLDQYETYGGTGTVFDGKSFEVKSLGDPLDPSDDVVVGLKAETTSRSILQGYSGGEIAFWWTPPNVIGDDQDVNIWISGGGTISKVTITVTDSGL